MHRCVFTACTLAITASWAAACSTSDRFEADAGEAPTRTDAGERPDATFGGGGGTGATGGGSLGAACERASDCEAGLVCDEESDQGFPAEALPLGVDEISLKAFPGGSCSPFAAAPYDGMGGSCDPTLPRAAQGCDDGACVPVAVVSGNQVETWYACRPACDPADAEGCGRFGYTCDFVYEACTEGCQSDEECQLRIVDLNGDGAREFQYDDTSRAKCDPDTFRCVHDGGADAETGDACVLLDDCEAEGLCLEHLQGWGGFAWPNGFCTKLGCDLEGRQCAGAGSTCAPLRTWSAGVVTTAVCLTACTVGAESKDNLVGPGGHGDGCREGYRCHYNGGAGAASGVCVGGNYNAVKTSNLGAACAAHSECYSPYGLGQCLTLSVGSVQAPSGVCTVMDCAAPGLPEDVCGGDNQCLGLSGDQSFCVQSCVDAGDCAEGFACANDDSDEGTPKVCFPACYEDADCRKGDETCVFALDPSTNMLATAGQCRPS